MLLLGFLIIGISCALWLVAVIMFIGIGVEMAKTGDEP